jgi:hypothetical protein
MKSVLVLRRLVSKLVGWWWRWMTVHAHYQMRAEVEALEHYRDLARGWDAHRPTRREDAKHFLPR